MTSPNPRHFLLISSVLMTALAACEPTTGAPAPSSPAPLAAGRTPHQQATAGLTLVTDASQVCMVNNQFMGRPQIPVQVEGKTYYGCCAMCEGRLQSDASARTAIDPISHAPVDKATAVIGKTESGAALYFASRDHFDSYARRAHAP